MDLKVKIGALGIADILKFLNMSKVREKTIKNAPDRDVSAVFAINDNAKALHPDCQKLIIDEIIDHKNADAKSFVFKNAEGGRIANFRAGQYISVQLKIGDSLVTRPYSVSSSPLWTKEGKLAITVKKAGNGFVSDFILNNWKTGDVVNASAAEGNFFHETLRDKDNVVALAGGSGITPFLSMAYAIRDKVENFNLTIIYGSKNAKSILFKKELDAIAKECDKVKVVYVLSDEEKKGCENGFITADIIKKYAPDEYSVFICGPEAMYRFVNSEIAKLNLPAKNVRREMLGVTKKIWEQDGYPQEAKDKVFNLTVKQGDKIFETTANASEPLLVAIEKAGINAPSRCRSGECGWCRSKLVSGEVFAPAENEFRRYSDKMNGYIHPCCTFPLSDCTLSVPGSYIG